MNSAAKVLQFPMGGIARDLDYRKAYIPSEGVAFATPDALNVMGECPLAERSRGGSRPGLKAVTGTITTDKYYWLWPNGDKIKWEAGTAGNAVFVSVGSETFNPTSGDFIPAHATFTVRASKGAVPTDATVMAKYRHRLVVAKDSMWYASRQGDLTDFDYGGYGEDIGRAAAGNVALANNKGETITAMAAIDDKMLFVATKRQLRLLVGEPTNGKWTTISEFNGIIGRDAWCWDGQVLWFMGTNGLYGVNPGEGVAKLASNRLPEDFKGFTTTTLLYDPERRGVHIFASKGEVVHDWYYDTEKGAFWPFAYNAQKRPVAGFFGIVDNVQRLIFKCADGAYRYLSESVKTDDGTAFNSYVVIGPIRASARDDMDGMVGEVSGVLALNSDDVTLKISTNHSPESAVGETSGTEIVMTAGWNNTTRPRTRGAWAIFKLSSTGKWGYESITAIFKQLGRLR